MLTCSRYKSYRVDISVAMLSLFENMQPGLIKTIDKAPLGLPVCRKRERSRILAPSEPPEIHIAGSTYGALTNISIYYSTNRRLLSEQIIFKEMCTHDRI